MILNIRNALIKNLYIFFIITMIFKYEISLSQSKDTIIVNTSSINVKNIKESSNEYLVYYKMKGHTNKTNYEFWSRVISFEETKGKKTIKINQIWENMDSIFHKSSTTLNKVNFKTIYHDVWWKKNNKKLTASFDFEAKKAIYDGEPLIKSKDSVINEKHIAFEKALNQNFLNWHLDLEVFQLLEYKKDAVYKINFYDPGFNEPKNIVYTVIGTDSLSGYNNQKIKCWLLFHEEQGSHKETFWISTSTNEVLKMEQEFGGNFRCKIKLGFN
ncbi:MAG: hypothetical protein ABI549_04230 [Flavobacterium sp.]|uniref:hypothetical protein n=1 Tax=Flavobacterium sp. TaxID=239 RepID=UPI003265ED97